MSLFADDTPIESPRFIVEQSNGDETFESPVTSKSSSSFKSLLSQLSSSSITPSSSSSYSSSISSSTTLIPILSFDELVLEVVVNKELM
ncbi:hypothetical protein PGB90_005983 [Kerria lacca]